MKHLPDNLKYAHIDDKKMYPVIISSKLSGEEEAKLLQVLKKHRGALGYTLDDLKGISPAICQHAINIEPDAKPVVEAQRRLIPKMKEVVRNEHVCSRIVNVDATSNRKLSSHRKIGHLCLYHHGASSKMAHRVSTMRHKVRLPKGDQITGPTRFPHRVD